MSSTDQADRAHELDYEYDGWQWQWQWYVRSCVSGRSRRAIVTVGERVTVACPACNTVLRDWPAA